jgi:hypothetical protein
MDTIYIFAHFLVKHISRAVGYDFEMNLRLLSLNRLEIVREIRDRAHEREPRREIPSRNATNASHKCGSCSFSRSLLDPRARFRDSVIFVRFTVRTHAC